MGLSLQRSFIFHGGKTLSVGVPGGAAALMTRYLGPRPLGRVGGPLTTCAQKGNEVSHQASGGTWPEGLTRPRGGLALNVSCG